MVGMLFWVATIAGSVIVLVLTAALRAAGDIKMAYVHIAVAAVVAILLALMGIRDTAAVVTAGGSRSAVGAAKARAMGLVWAWGALCLGVTYGTGILGWKEWWHFFIPFAVASALCLFFAATLAKDDAAGKEDESMLKLSRYLAMFQLGGMLVTMIGLVIDGKMTRFLNPRPGWEDWAANNYFFFGAMALAALSIHALRTQARVRPAGSSV